MPASHTVPESLTLLADIGGTNTRVALARDGRLITDSVAKFRNEGRRGLEDILTDYLQDPASVGAELAARHGMGIDGACVAVAGPVAGDGSHAKMTNLDWDIRAASLAVTCGAGTVSIINDLQAQGHALGSLPESSLRPVLAGTPAEPQATRLVVGVGTGFNAAPVYQTPGGRYVAASECGHVTLPVQSEDDIALKRYLERKHVFASVEHACAGRGLERIHAFVTGRDDVVQHGEEILSLMQAGDAHALRSAAIFIRILGAAVGDLALTHLPFGGIYLIGGAARAVAPWLEQFGFADSFHAKGRFGPFMQQFAVTVVEDDYAALTGCASHLRDTLARR